MLRVLNPDACHAGGLFACRHCFAAGRIIKNMFDITQELDEFITVLYGHGPKMDMTWGELYPDAFRKMAGDVFRMQVASRRAAVPFEQAMLMTFLVYEERAYINNAKFIHVIDTDQGVKLLTISQRIKTKAQAEFNRRMDEKKNRKGGTADAENIIQ